MDPTRTASHTQIKAQSIQTLRTVCVKYASYHPQTTDDTPHFITLHTNSPTQMPPMRHTHHTPIHRTSSPSTQTAPHRYHLRDTPITPQYTTLHHPAHKQPHPGATYETHPSHPQYTSRPKHTLYTPPTPCPTPTLSLPSTLTAYTVCSVPRHTHPPLSFSF